MPCGGPVCANVTSGQQPWLVRATPLPRRMLARRTGRAVGEANEPEGRIGSHYDCGWRGATQASRLRGMK